MTCRHILPLLDSYADGELVPDKMLEVEQHLSDCADCLARVRLTAAIMISTREVARQTAPVSPAFQARMVQTLVAERERAAERTAERMRPTALPWRSIFPIAAAAAITLVWAAAVEDRPERYSAATPTVAASLTDGADQLIDDFVRLHARGDDIAEPSVAEPSLIGQLEPQVGVPVHAPSLSEYGASWEGGTVIRVTNLRHRAALLRYRVGNHRVSVYVYDAARWPLRARLEPRVVRDVPVYVGMRRGYSIAATERHGVGYAAAADLNDEETAELVAAAYP
jgi:anti-sigma factor RsiW